MKFSKSLREAAPLAPGQTPGQVPAPGTIDTQDLSDPLIASLTQKKVTLQKQMQNQIAAIDAQIANRQRTNGKNTQGKPPVGGNNVPGM